MNSHIPTSDLEHEFVHADQCATGLFEGASVLLDGGLEQGDTRRFEYPVGELACAAWLVEPTVGLHRSDESKEIVIAPQSPEAAPTHYLYFPDSANPYWLVREEQGINNVGNESSLLMQCVAENKTASIYRIPSEAVSMTSVVLDALPGHSEMIKKVYANTLNSLKEFAVQLGCLPLHLNLDDFCVSRETGEPKLIPPIKLRSFGAAGAQSQLLALAYELASDIQKRAATTGKLIDLHEELTEFSQNL